jgi:hypothetical protein
LARKKKHPAYRVWRNMKTRCYNPQNRAFKTYGGRGIRVCSEWLNSPDVFVAWALSNGWASDLTIDRINNDDDYSPSNCAWVSKPENARRGNVYKRAMKTALYVLATLSLPA